MEQTQLNTILQIVTIISTMVGGILAYLRLARGLDQNTSVTNEAKEAAANAAKVAKITAARVEAGVKEVKDNIEVVRQDVNSKATDSLIAAKALGLAQGHAEGVKEERSNPLGPLTGDSQ